MKMQIWMMNSCEPIVYGCTVFGYSNYNSNANIDNGSCSNSTIDIIGCTDSSYYEYDPNATLNNQDYCLNVIVEGCMAETAFNYNADANTDDGSCEAIVEGCMNDKYLEYNSNANTSDGSCSEFLIPGCSDPFAFNYNVVSDSTWLADNPTSGVNQNVNYDDGSCIEVIECCMNSDYLEYYNQDPIPNSGEDSIYCFNPVNSGCTDDSYLEYYSYFEVSSGVYIIGEPIDTTINYNDGSCVTLIVEGCMYELYQQYNPEANVSNPSQCVNENIYGCTDSEADNFEPEATADDGSCLIFVTGCMDENYLEFNPQANTTSFNDGQDINCETPVVNGCNNPNYLQFYSYSTEAGPNGELFNIGNPLNDGANVDDGCIDSLVYGCPYSQFIEYDSLVNVFEWGTPACQTVAVEGCTDQTALNFSPSANVDDGSCIPAIEGCTDNSLLGYNPFANVDDGSCGSEIVLGCIDSTALNYDSLANFNDGSCIDVVYGCTSDSAFNYNVERTLMMTHVFQL